MSRLAIYIAIILAISGCNSVNVKPNSLDTSQVFYADRGGYSMRRSIKETMEARGYNVVVGRAKSNEDINDGTKSVEVDKNAIPSNVRYIVKVSERSEFLRPIWCIFNGFWWWNFNVSIADQNTEKELLTWRGRGCANSSVRLLERILDDMEK